MNVNTIVNRVANGRRLAARSIVMQSLSTIPALVFRKRLIPNDPATPTASGLSWNGIANADVDEPEYEYDDIGAAMVLMDSFTGAAVLENNSMSDSNDFEIMAQIEPYDDSLDSERERLTNIPEWLPERGDIFGLAVAEDFVVWLELMDITGSSLLGDFGKRYLLNKLDNLDFLDPLKSEFDARPIA